MHRYAILALLAVTPILEAQTAATRAAPSKGWLSDLESGKALAAKSDKPLMVIFRCDP